MTLKTKLREALIKITGYWIYKKKDIPIGCDIINDINNKIGLEVKTAFDLGANIGQTAVKFSRYLNEPSIYSFEPVSSTFQTLQDTTKELKTVQCFKMALGSEAESVEIDIFDDELSVLNSIKKSAQNKGAKKKEVINITTGDSFCKEHNINEIDLLKIDTEGYELQVLEGFQEMINKAKIKTIYCETGFSPNNTRNTYINDLIEFASKNNFNFYGLYEVSNLQIKTGNNYGNILFIHDTLAKKYS